MTTPQRTPARNEAFAREHGVGAAVGVEALHIEAERLCAGPQMRVLESPLVGEQRVVHAPERALQSRRLAAHAAGHARGCEERTGKCRKHLHVQLRERHVEHRAERALVVAVDHDEPTLPANMVGRPHRGQGSRTEVAQSASKMRFAPGSTPGFSA